MIVKIIRIRCWFVFLFVFLLYTEFISPHKTYRSLRRHCTKIYEHFSSHFCILKHSEHQKAWKVLNECSIVWTGFSFPFLLRSRTLKLQRGFRGSEPGLKPPSRVPLWHWRHTEYTHTVHTPGHTPGHTPTVQTLAHQVLGSDRTSATDSPAHYFWNTSIKNCFILDTYIEI